MSEETLAAILREMRGNEFDDPHLNADGIIGARRLARDWADRIEAAAKRERAITDVMLAVKDKPLPHPDPEHAPPLYPVNAAALREALQNLCACTSCDWACIGRTGFDPLNETCLRCTGRPEKDGDCPWIQARAALAAPARNCDRFAKPDDAMRAFAAATGTTTIDLDAALSFAAWLFALERSAHA